MGETFGESPRPWTFVLGKPASDNEAELIKSIPGTVEFTYNISTVRQENFDAAIVLNTGMPVKLAAHLMVIRIGGTGVMDGMGPVSHTPYFQIRDSGHSTLLTIETQSAPDGVSLAELRALAERIKSERPHGLIHRGIGNLVSDFEVNKIISEKDGYACVGWWVRPNHRRKDYEPEFWWFPSDSPGLASWRAALYSRWNRIAPQNFPDTAEDWTKSSDWITFEEIAAIQALEKHENATEEIISLRKQEASALRQDIAKVTKAANSGARLLLTSQGKHLVATVASTLTDLGFTVIDSDEQKESGAYLLEDLKVIRPDWVCLAEVRGYTKGAKTSDFQRIERAVRHYEREHGTPPSARWYIVNHNLKTNPSSRPAVLSGATDDIEVFAEENGLVIDTRDLFRLAREVKEGRLSAEKARELLMTSSGVLSFPPMRSHSPGPSGDELGGQTGGQTEEPEPDTSGL